MESSVQVQNLSYAYSEKPLFQDLNLDFQKGAITLVRGPSGCGKSTFLKLVGGLMTLQSGKIKIETFVKNIGYVHQDCHLIDHWNIQENLSLVSSEFEKYFDWMKLFDLKMPLENLVGNLSGGEKQRVSLVRMFLQNPDLILLDEPTAHLDDDHTDAALKLIKDKLKNKTVIIVSHDKRVINYSDKILEWKRDIQP